MEPGYIRVDTCIALLLSGAPRTVDFTDVTQSLLEIQGVREVHDLRMWSLSMNKIAMAVHLAVGVYTFQNSLSLSCQV